MNKIEQAFSNIQNGKHQHGWPQFRNRRYCAKLFYVVLTVDSRADEDIKTKKGADESAPYLSS